MEAGKVEGELGSDDVQEEEKEGGDELATIYPVLRSVRGRRVFLCGVCVSELLFAAWWLSKKAKFQDFSFFCSSGHVMQPKKSQKKKLDRAQILDPFGLKGASVESNGAQSSSNLRRSMLDRPCRWYANVGDF